MPVAGPVTTTQHEHEDAAPAEAEPFGFDDPAEAADSGE
jgi:hypothetical protein